MPAEPFTPLDENGAGNSSKPRRSALMIVYFTVFLDLLGFGIVLPFLPYFAEDLVLEERAVATVVAASIDVESTEEKPERAGAEVGIVLTAYSLAQLLGAFLLGRLSDRFGRRPVLILSLAGAALAMAASGLAKSLFALAAARALAGLFGGSISTAQAYIADVTSIAERARYMGFLGAAIGLGFVIGPAFGVGLGALGLGFAGAAFCAAGLAATNFLWAIFKLPESRPIDAAHARPRLGDELAILVRPNFWQVLAASFLTTLAFVAMETTFALYGGERFGMNEKSFGLVLVFVGVVMIVVQGGLIGRATSRFGIRAVAIAGGLLIGVAMLAIPLSPGFYAVVMALGLLAAGQGLSVPTHSTLLSHLSGVDEQGAVLGARQSLTAGARALGPIVAGSLYDHLHVAAPYVMGGLLALLAGVLLMSVRARS